MTVDTLTREDTGTWRQIPGYPDYEANRVGEVRSLKGPKPRILAASIGVRGGYLTVHVEAANGNRITKTVHSLVALAFLGPRPPGAEIRHLDGKPLNNDMRNLVYGSRSENALDSVRHGTHRNQNTGRSHCHRGHEFTPENTQVIDGRRRRCRACKNEWQRKYRLLRKRGRAT